MNNIEIEPKVLLDRIQVYNVWKWLVANINNRPALSPELCFVDDHKLWGINLSQPLASSEEFQEKIAQLFLISQLGEIPQVIELSKGGDSFSLFLVTQHLDQDIKVVIESEDRFRDGLSEHLGFWVTLGSLVKSNLYTNYAISQPNFQPEDKGPDGLFLGLDEAQQAHIELRSIKNSVGNPYYLVASANFRNGGDAQKSKQLEEFYLLVEEEYGFARLDRLLAQVSSYLSLESNQLTRAVLLKNSAKYNAVVVANEAFYSSGMFNGFQRVIDAPDKCIATYIGSDVWTQFAENVRNKVISILQSCGAW
jgi:hypothetical protein